MSGGFNNHERRNERDARRGESNSVTSAGAMHSSAPARRYCFGAVWCRRRRAQTTSRARARTSRPAVHTASGEGAVVERRLQEHGRRGVCDDSRRIPNYAAGVYSFAAGSHASALLNGTFVWSDGSDGDAYLTAHTRTNSSLARRRASRSGRTRPIRSARRSRLVRGRGHRRAIGT